MLAVLLALSTVALYLPALDHGFLLFDDEGYVTGNPVVPRGLTSQGIAWAFSSVGYAGNWHPLTWLSHMLDVQLFGLEPRWHHLTSVALHAANALLLLAVLRSLTGALWRSAAVALLFAVHPLHVESVAWVAERKDVLCGFFTLLALGAYAAYASRPGRVRYLLVASLFALALLSKPMAVTLPFLLLLLDFWPLGRWTPWRGTAGAPGPRESPGDASVARLLLEKTPLFAMSAASAAVSFFAQETSGSVTTTSSRSLAQAAANAALFYAAYIGTTLWPQGLAAFYPYPPTGPGAPAVAGVALLLLGITVAVILGARRLPYLAAGWAWYVGMLVPVIGLVQVGAQARADRYTYLPHCGLFVMLAWGVGNTVAWRGRGRQLLVAVGVAALAVPLVAITRAQIGTWRDDTTLAGHALAVTRDNWLMHYNLGLAQARQGMTVDAIAHYREAVRMRPVFDRGWNNLGAALQALGRHQEAAAAFENALRWNPRYGDAHYNYAITLTALGNIGEAERQYRDAVRIDPRNSDAHANLGELLVRQGRLGEATAALALALSINPADAYAHANLGVVFERSGRRDEAIDHYRKALALRPDLASTRANLARALRQRGDRPLR